MTAKLRNSHIQKHFLRIGSSLRLLYSHLSVTNWPRKRLSQVAYIASISIAVVVLLKFSLHAVPLRSESRSLRDIVLSSRLLNIEDFQWLMNNESLCKKEQDDTFLMVILVHTARNHFPERNSIRNTWGSLRTYKSWTLRVLFLLGTSNEELEIERKLEAESQLYGDMVMGNFIDTYKNLTYKHVMGYKWIVNYCSDATFVWKVDDDMFIDPLTLIEWRNHEINNVASESGAGGSPKMLDFYCAMFSNAEPQRDPSSKWFVSQETWPLSKYPTYCSGWAYGVSVPWIRRIYSASESVRKVLWIDDVFVTGSLVNIVQKLTNESPFVKDIWRYATFMYNPIKTSFCLNDSKVNETKRRFGAIGRLLRGDTLVRESKCLWENIITGKWKPIR